jgi:flagellar biosynthesis/type III secretory pathway protein FliH
VVPSAVLGARARAAEILAAAEAEAAALRSEARRRGEEEARAEVEAAFSSLLVGARLDAERVRAAALPAARTLAARMAEKIVGRAVELDPDLGAAIAARALEAARPRGGTVILRVHPDDVAALEPRRGLLLARLAKVEALRIVADPAVGRAGCIVDTPAGRLDARLTTQLAVLERAVFGENKDGNGSGSGSGSGESSG